MDPRENPSGLGRTALLAAVVFAVPLALWPASTSYAEAKLAAALTLIGLLWVVRAAESIRCGRLSVRVPLPAWGFAGAVAAILVSAAAATVPGIWWEAAIGFVGISSMVLLCASIVRSRAQVRGVIWALSAAATGVAGYALLQGFGAMAASASGGPISTMGNPNLVGGFLVVILPAALAPVWFARTIVRRVVALMMVAVQLSTLAILDHAGGLAAICIALLFVAVAALASGAFRAIFRRDGWSIFAVSLIAAGVLAAACLGPGQSILHRDQGAAPADVSALWEENSGAERATFWRTAAAMFADRPWTGVGLGHFQIEYLDTLAELADRPDGSIIVPPRPTTHAHNDYLQVIAETGVWGLMAIVVTIGLLVVFAVWRVRAADEDQRMELLLLFGGIVAYAVLAAVSFPMYSVSTSWPAVILLGLAGGSSYGERGVRIVRVAGRLRFAAVAGAAVLTAVVAILAWRGFVGDLLVHRGSLQLQEGFAAASEATLTRSITVDPNPREAFYFRAIARILQAEQAKSAGDAVRAARIYQAAAEDLTTCETRFPWPEVYLAEANLGLITGDRMVSEAAIDLLVALGQPTEIYVQALYLQAYLAREDGRPADAQSILLQITAADPDYNRAYIALGDLRAAEGDREAARRQYEVALSRAQSKLSDAERQLTSSAALSSAERGRLRDATTEAQQEIRLAVEALAQLSESELPSSPSPTP